MRRIAHLSDLHFGALHHESLTPLRATLETLDPDLIVISGDLTQRGRRSEFRAARAFVERLPPRAKLVVVPGNHDIPWNPLVRWRRPRGRFDAHITGERFPAWWDDEVAVVGLDSTRRAVLRNGRLNRAQLRQVSRMFREPPPEALRVVVLHHPLVEGHHRRAAVAHRAALALRELGEAGVDLLLTGHRHQTWSGHHELELGGRHIVVAHAGTTTSRRVRGSPNAFNVIDVDIGSLQLRELIWTAGRTRFEDAGQAPARTFPRRLRDGAPLRRNGLP